MSKSTVLGPRVQNDHNIVTFLTNQIADILFVSDKQLLWHGAECNMGNIFNSQMQFISKIAKCEKRGKYLPILHEATCDNYFIFKRFLKSNVAKVILLNYQLHRTCLRGYSSDIASSYYLHPSKVTEHVTSRGEFKQNKET